MLYTIVNDQPFQVLSDSFTISPSESGYELYLSADGVNYSQFITVPSGVTKQMVDMNNGNFYRLMGNTSIVTVNWSRDCCGGQGGGGGVAGVSSLNGQTGALTTKTINGNDILGSGDITIEGGAAQYDLDAMTQAERAEFVAMCENLTDEERRLLFVYRDGVICTFDHTEGSGGSFKIMFFDTRNDGWSYTTTKYRHFSVKADGSYEELGYGVFPEIITYDTNYSDTTHALSSSDNFSPLNAISNLNAGQDGKLALNLRLIIQSNPAKIVLSSKAWSEKIGQFEGKIGAEWHYNGNVIKAVWNVVEHNATIESWTEVPGGESSDYSTEFNKVKTVEHKGFVKYVFTHSGNTWDGNESPIATITNGDNSAQLSFYDNMTGTNDVYVNFSGYPAFHIANEAPFRLNMRLQSYPVYKNFPDFYFQYQTENGYDNTYNIIVPSGYTVTPVSELRTGYAYEGSESFSFNEIVPVSPMMIQPDFTGDTAYAVMKYIITHRFDEILPVCTNKHILNGGNGEAGQEISYLVEPSDRSNAFTAYFIADGQQKNIIFNGHSYSVNSGDFGKSISLISFGNNLSLDVDTDVLYQNGEAMSTGSSVYGIIDFGIVNYILNGEFYGDNWFVSYYGLRLISGGTQTGVICNPSISRTQLPATVTIDGKDYAFDYAFDYGSIILRAYCNGDNMCANFRVERRKDTVSLSQSDYDALVQAGTVDANTLYVII